ncbi:hypothetical protein BBF96_11000 [Anoxybacter fermentans]|uniref:Flagellar protein FliL n=1 Tax=Anoxybacter fermentans TaxID=1323375 RepID=A0A3Q9HR62_9FIRM|nr:flagellar basal body-associated FliL family protein [Anoxybacter fermentans]AZR73869.1 hypothetical protein BBF96_11000 [Anoxybacter fermentans]
MSDSKPTGISWPIVLGIIILVILITAGTSFLMMYLFSNTQAKVDLNNENASKKKVEEMGPSYNLGEFVVNLSGSRGYRFLKVNLVVEVNKESVIKELEERDPQLRDAINEILRSQTSEDIEDPSLIKLKTQIINKLNEFLAKGEVKNVFITEFVVQ